MIAPSVNTESSPQRAGFIQTLAWMGAGLLFIVAVYVSGVKPIGISADLRNYELLYNASAINDWRSIFQAGDAGYFALAKFAAMLGWSFDLFAFALAAVTCTLLFMVATRIDTNRVVLIALYASYPFWLHEYTQIRIAAALALGLYAIYVARPPARWLLFALGLLLHYSFILFVAAHTLVRIRRVGTIAALGAVALLLALGPFASIVNGLVERIVTYQDLASTTGQFSTINLFSLMPLVQILGIGCAAFHFKELPRDAREEMLLSVLGVLSFYVLSSVPVLAFRTYEMFMPFFVILLSRLTRRSYVVWAIILIWMALGIRSSFLSADSVVIL